MSPRSPSATSQTKPPKIKLHLVESIAQRVQWSLEPHHGQQMTTDLCVQLTQDVRGVRGLPSLVRDTAIFNTLLQYTDRPLTTSLTGLIAWQLAGRYEELIAGPLIAYNGPSRSEWVAVQIRSLVPVTWRERDRGRLMHMFALYGQPAGQVLTRKIPESYLRWLAYQIGFSRRIIYDDEPRHFMGLKMWFYMQTDAETGEYDITEYAVNSSMNKFNREIVKCRMRWMCDVGDDPCPKSYSWPCLECKQVDCLAHYGRYSV